MKIGVMERATENTVYTYVYDRFKTFTEYPEITYIQYEITEGTDTGAYYIDNNIVRFDSSWVPPAVSYTASKSEEFLEKWDVFEELMADLAAENSEILLAYVYGEIVAGNIPATNNQAEIFAAVKPIVKEFAEHLRTLREDIRAYNYYTIEDEVAVIPRDTLLQTDERLLIWQQKMIDALR